LWASAVAAIVGSLCCVAPLVLLTLGISGAWISEFPLDARPVKRVRIRGYSGGN
jgi:hypothetical protein